MKRDLERVDKERRARDTGNWRLLTERVVQEK